MTLGSYLSFIGNDGGLTGGEVAGVVLGIIITIIVIVYIVFFLLLLIVLKKKEDRAKCVNKVNRSMYVYIYFTLWCMAQRYFSVRVIFIKKWEGYDTDSESADNVLWLSVRSIDIYISKAT